MGDLPSRALKAWLHLDGKEGVARDVKRAFELAEEGERSGCHHCQGVLARCYFDGVGCDTDEERSLELALKSSENGSKYGQCALGACHCLSDGAPAVALYHLAAVQGLDSAQAKLGEVYDVGYGVAEDNAESKRWYRLAAAQGHPDALYWVAFCHMQCFLQADGVPVAVAEAAEAIRWFKRAQAAGHSDTSRSLRTLQKWLRNQE